MTTSADIVSTLFAHGMILGRTTTNPYSTALTAQTKEGCKNPNCKARDPSTHTTENCYWPGGGKEGQFPANFGQRFKVNMAVSSPKTAHFALSARIPRTLGQSGIIIGTITNINPKHCLDVAINDHDGHQIDHINSEPDIIPDTSDAPPDPPLTPQSTSHCMSASVGEQLLNPLTAVNEIEHIIINHPIRDHHDFDLHGQVINTTSAKSIPQSYRHTTILLEPTDDIFDDTSSTDDEIGRGRNKIGGVWEIKDMGEIRSARLPVTLPALLQNDNNNPSPLPHLHELDNTINHQPTITAPTTRERQLAATNPTVITIDHLVHRNRLKMTNSTITKPYVNSANPYPFTNRVTPLTNSTVSTMPLSSNGTTIYANFFTLYLPNHTHAGYSLETIILAS
jgi:hypothetical protein